MYQDTFLTRHFTEWSEIANEAGGLLRGNRKAIQYFSSVNGPDVLYDLFSYLVERDGDSMTLKLLSKIITLADDLVMDVVLHSDTSGGVHVTLDL